MTNEQRLRGTDRGVDAALIVMGCDGEAVAACAGRLCALDALPRHGATHLASALYRTSDSLARAELDP